MPSWRYVTDEEYESLPRVPVNGTAIVFGESNHDIYRVAEDGILLGRDGDVVVVEAGEKVKILDEPVDEAWCYLVQELSVHLPGGDVGILKESSPVAVLDPDYKQKLAEERKT